MWWNNDQRELPLVMNSWPINLTMQVSEPKKHYSNELKKVDTAFHQIDTKRQSVWDTLTGGSWALFSQVPIGTAYQSTVATITHFQSQGHDALEASNSQTKPEVARMLTMRKARNHTLPYSPWITESKQRWSPWTCSQKCREDLADGVEEKP